MYFPKSQITTNLYTNGKEYAYIGTDKEYIGYYFQTSEGRLYTGKNPNDPPVEEIIIFNPNISSQELDDTEGELGGFSTNTKLYLIPDAYAIASNIGLNAIPLSPPTKTIILPTEDNYKLGEYQRYFASKNNEIRYIEITQEEYTKFTNQDPYVDYFLYTAFKFPWLISGNRSEVVNVNKKTIERVTSNLTLSGFKSYFKNRYDQYFKYAVGSNLKTDGTEFLNESTGERYVGLYHVHPEKGPMVGAEHIPQIHDYLIPVSGSNMGYKVNKMETQNSQNKNTKYVGY